MPGTARPCFSLMRRRSSSDRAAKAGLGAAQVPRGLHSVMPQAWSTRTPYSRPNASISIAGQAEPPQISRRRVSSRPPVARRCCSRPSHTVGTPAETVTLSALLSACRLGPSSWRPGMTSAAPTIGAAYGVPQALTWNIGTTGITRSMARRPNTSGRLTA